MRNRLILYRKPFSWRVTTHQAVIRLILRMERHGKFGVELRKVGYWLRYDLEKRLYVH